MSDSIVPMVHPELDLSIKKNPIRGTGTILVIDDEEIVRNITVRILSQLGYKVFSASDGGEGISFYEKKRDEIDLVIIDMVMPILSGRECFLQLKKLDENVKVILTTGYSINIAEENLYKDGIQGFIPKPFVITQLSEIIAKALASGNMGSHLV